MLCARFACLCWDSCGFLGFENQLGLFVVCDLCFVIIVARLLLYVVDGGVFIVVDTHWWW